MITHSIFINTRCQLVDKILGRRRRKSNLWDDQTMIFIFRWEDVCWNKTKLWGPRVIGNHFSKFKLVQSVWFV